MKQQLIQPQEIEVFYILPAIRSRMASALKKNGKSQKEIARLLCVQESTVSQYLSSKRAANVKFNTAINNEIVSAAKKIATKESLIRETQHILDKVRASKEVLCGLHKAVADVPDGCEACFGK
ncbi:TPA: helix-turn-helix domain-containing protein [Candidatus Woesearchaeota archaeon]|nr:helix-turn-helix domain-containing protein [Candidatus Woesearchaeota archaeon]